LDNRRWEQQDEARYLMALAFFGQENYEEALNELAKIQDPEIRREGEKATYDIMKDANLSWMLRNLGKYEDNKGLALAIRDQLERKTVMSTEERRAYHEVRELSKDSDVLQHAEGRRDENQVLEMAVVLPFNYSGGSGVSRLSSNNFVFEYFQGLKMAVDEAKKQGVDLKIRTFDTERNPAVVERILEDPFLQVADVIIGPVYPEETNIVSVYAEQYNIPHINPLSNLDDNLKVGESAYLFRPSTKAMSQGILDYVNRKALKKRIAIAYSATSKDEQLARQLTEDARRRGVEVVKSEKIDGKGVRGFFSSLGVERAGEPSVEMIIVLSDDPNVASPTFSVIESLNARIPVLVPDSWLYFNFANFEMMEHQNVHFIGNNTINFESEDLADFRENFLERYETFPGIFAHLGYETVYWIQENLNPHKGFDFAKNLNRAGFHEGKLTFGFNFQDARANQYVPIMRLENGTLEIE
jgi:hypothetical protein